MASEAERIASKLTRPQQAELRRFAAADDTPTSGCLHYPPFMRLWDRELVRRANGRWCGDVFVITDLGRAVVLALRDRENRDEG